MDVAVLVGIGDGVSIGAAESAEVGTEASVTEAGRGVARSAGVATDWHAEAIKISIKKSRGKRFTKGS